MDKLSTLLGRHTLSAELIFNGEFCDANEFPENGDVGHMHLIRRGPVHFSHVHAPAVEVDEPAVVFYPRGMSHRLRVPHGQTASLVCATVSYMHGGKNSLAKVLPECIHLPFERMPAVRPILDTLFGEAAARTAGSEVILDRLFEVFTIQVIRNQCDSDGISIGVLAGLDDPHLSRALLAMHEQPDVAWQLPALARVAGMSRSRFAEHFHSVVGETPAAYLTQWKMKLARRLLLSGLPVKVVSARLGYRSPSIFTRAFTNVFGRSPRAWSKDAVPTA